MLQNDMSQSHKKINIKKINKHFNLNKYTLYIYLFKQIINNDLNAESICCDCVICDDSATWSPRCRSRSGIWAAPTFSSTTRPGLCSSRRES